MREAFNVLARTRISDTREVVISRTDSGKITVAQRMIIKEGTREVGMFMKASMHVDDKDKLIEFRNALNVAIAQIEK